MDEETNAAAIAAAERHEEVFAAVGRHPNEATGFDDDAAAEDRPPRRPREGAGDRRDRARLLPRQRRPGRPAPRLRGPDRDRPRARPADRDPRPRPRGRAARRSTRSSPPSTPAPPAHPVILHCFSAPQRVDDAAERGWYCSFAGNVTYPKAEALREAAAQVPEDLLLVETDAPYLAPQPMRGKRNEPANVVATARARRRGPRRLLRGARAHGRGQRPRALRLVAPLGPARPELPRRPQPARRDRPRRGARPGRRRARGRGRGGGADRAPGRGRRATSTRSRSTAACEPALAPVAGAARTSTCTGATR